MTSKLGYAILALLARQPGTGYELSARARRPLGYFWSARHSQVYPELQKLLDAGLVSFSPAPGPGPLDKKVYSLTRARARQERAAPEGLRGLARGPGGRREPVRRPGRPA